jgi:hypothetical protein
VVAPPQKDTASAAKHEPPKAETPHAAHEETKEPAKEQAKQDEAKPAAQPESKKDWKKWALYGGLVVGNLLILGLGFVAYRLIMGGNKSKVLDEAEDEDAEAAEKSGDAKERDKKKGGDGKEKAKRAKADLPDDAIDLDSGDKKK